MEYKAASKEKIKEWDEKYDLEKIRKEVEIIESMEGKTASKEKLKEWDKKYDLEKIRKDIKDIEEGMVTDERKVD